MESVIELFKAAWQKIKSIYDIYTMLLGMGIGAFCYFIDGTGYDKKGLERERIAAKATGICLFISVILLYILVKIL